MRVVIVQVGADDGAAVIIGDEAADDAGFDDVGFDQREAGGIGLERGRNDRAAVEAAFHHFVEAHIGRVEAGDVGAVHAGQEEYFVGEAAQGVEEFRLEDIAVLGFQCHQQQVAAAEFLLRALIGFDIGVVAGQQLVEAGVGAQMRGEVA